MEPTAALPYFTADLPGIGGAIKVQPADFLVEEIPAYAPAGHGPHVFVWIEKRGRTTHDVLAEMARALRRDVRDLGFAGMKDARAVARQMISIEGVDPDEVADLELRGVRVLRVGRHTNKLKLGHLRGNRFALKLRGCRTGAEVRARAIMEVLQRRGVPNYFGPQRFGNRGDNHEAGWAILRGDHALALEILLGRPSPDDRPNLRRARQLYMNGRFAEAARQWPGAFQWQQRACRVLAKAHGKVGKAWSSIDKPVKTFLLQAAQSDLFNRVLAGRIGEIDRVEAGDVAVKHDNGACFVVTDAAAEVPRCATLEISPTGPLFGERLTAAEGARGRLEARLLAEAGVTAEALAALGPLAPQGQRRPLRVPLNEVDVGTGRDRFGPYLRLAFMLPSGSYATAVTREITKSANAG